MRLLTATLALSLCSAAPAWADEIHPELIAKDARWVAHVDLDGLFHSRLFAEFRKQDEAGLTGRVDAIRNETGIDILQDLHSVTLYGTDESEEAGVLVLHGGDALDHLLDRIGELDGYRKTTIDGHEIHLIGDPDQKPVRGRLEVRGSRDHLELGLGAGGDGMAGAILKVKGGGRLVAVSRDPERLVHALEVLHGRSPSLLGTEGRVPVHAAPGTLLYVAADLDGSRLKEVEPVSRVAKMARRVSFELGENQEDLFLDARLETRDEAAAKSIGQIVQGAAALAQLAAANGDGDQELKELAGLLDTLHAEVDGSTVHLSFALPLEKLVELAQRRGGF